MTPAPPNPPMPAAGGGAAAGCRGARPGDAGAAAGDTGAPRGGGGAPAGDGSPPTRGGGTAAGDGGCGAAHPASVRPAPDDPASAPADAPPASAPGTGSGRPVRILVVDDSAFMRQVIRRILESDPALQVVGTARDGLEAVARAAQLQPDVVTLDVEMPRLDGLGALPQILAVHRCAVVMVSSLTQRGAAATVRALALGAVDFVAKPSGAVSLDLDRVAAELVAKVKAAAAIPPERLLPPPPGTAPGADRRGRSAPGAVPRRGPGPLPARGRARPVGAGTPVASAGGTRTSRTSAAGGAAGGAASEAGIDGTGGAGTAGDARTPAMEGAQGKDDGAVIIRKPAPAPARLTHLVLVAASTGGPGALYRLLGGLPADLPAAVVVVQHMPPGFTRALAEHLDAVCGLRVREAAEGSRLVDGTAWVAPGDHHLHVGPGGVLGLDRSPPRHGVRPAADVTFASVPPALARRTIALVLTGMGVDGAAGARYLREHGARIWVQEPASCVVPGMPVATAALGVVERAGTPEQLAAWLVETLTDPGAEATPVRP